MKFDIVTQKSISLFTAIGGWRTVAEGVASRVVFLCLYLLTEQVVTSVLAAFGCVLVLAVIRVCIDRNYWSATVGLVLVGVSALLAGSTGNAVDFYLPAVIVQAGGGTVFLVSMLVRWPMVGLAMGTVRGERVSWRQDKVQLRRYQACTAFFLVKSGIATAVLVPLYLTEQVTSLGIAATLLGGAPASGVCIYLCWRYLRTPTPEPAAAELDASGTLER